MCGTSTPPCVLPESQWRSLARCSTHRHGFRAQDDHESSTIPCRDSSEVGAHPDVGLARVIEVPAWHGTARCFSQGVRQLKFAVPFQHSTHTPPISPLYHELWPRRCRMLLVQWQSATGLGQHLQTSRRPVSCKVRAQRQQRRAALSKKSLTSWCYPRSGRRWQRPWSPGSNHWPPRHADAAAGHTCSSIPPRAPPFRAWHTHPLSGTRLRSSVE